MKILSLFVILALLISCTTVRPVDPIDDDPIQPQPQPVESGHYILQFANFSGERADKLSETILDLSTGNSPHMKVLPGQSSVPNFKEYSVKWLKQQSPVQIIEIIQEYALNNELSLTCTNSSPGILIFEPAANRSNDDF